MKLLTLLRSTKRRNRRAAIRITTGVILFGLILSLITLNAIHSFDDIKGLEELPTDAELEEQAKPERPEIPKPITVHDLFKRTDSTIIEAEDL